MTPQPITITAAPDAAFPAIVDFILAQQSRQHSQNPRLRNVGSRSQIEMMLTRHHTDDSPSLIAVDSTGRIRGYAHPSVWIIKEGSILHSFLTARNGIVQSLTLPNPADADAEAVVSALLLAFQAFWQRVDTTGDLLRWPSDDCWFDTSLRRYGFKLDSICAFRAPGPFFSSSRRLPTNGQRVRTAQPDDEEAIVNLFQEELRFHEGYTCFVRSSSRVLDAFRLKLARMWKGEDFEEGAPLVLVVEQAHEIVAMVENTLLDITDSDEPGFTPPGRYWCIDNMSVLPHLQGQGIGRLLVQSIEDVRSALQLQPKGYVLWFNPENPKAARFWPQLGFQSLWTTYQRLHQEEAHV